MDLFGYFFGSGEDGIVDDSVVAGMMAGQAASGTARAHAAPANVNGRRILLLHGWRTSGDILKLQCRDLMGTGNDAAAHYIDSPLPASG